MSMIERVAEGQAGYDGRTLSGMSRGERERYFERARIAIRNMREFSPDLDDWGVEGSAAYRATLDAALEVAQ